MARLCNGIVFMEQPAHRLHMLSDDSGFVFVEHNSRNKMISYSQ